MSETETPAENICTECGYAKDSELHQRGVGLHGHFSGPAENLTDAAIRRLTHSALVGYAQSKGYAANPALTRGDIFELLGMERK